MPITPTVRALVAATAVAATVAATTAAAGPAAAAAAPAQIGYSTTNGGTTGGAAGPTVTVTSWSQLKTEAGKKTPETILVSGLLSGTGQIQVRNDKTIRGVGASSGLVGGGLKVTHYNNVIIQNLKISMAKGTDAITIQDADHIWIDHNELWSDRAHDIDYYDGLIDIVHASDWVTVSWNRIHDHWKTSLVGHDDDNGAEDTGHLTVTYHHNEFYNLDARQPSIRFGTAHIFNNYFHDSVNAVHSRMSAQVLVEGNVFRNVSTPIKTTTLSIEDGYAVERNNQFDNCGPLNITRVGSFTRPPYSYTLDATASVPGIVAAGAGTGKV
jgi:pectate lyase